MGFSAGGRSLLACLLVLSSYSFAAPWTCRISYVHLTNLAYALDMMRTPEEKTFYQLYKNDPHFQPWLMERAQAEYALPDLLTHYAKEKAGFRPTLKFPAQTRDLTSPEIEKVSDELCAACRGASGLKRYDEWVIGLRQGDTVVFSGKKFVLGKYLGAGGAAQVFEIQGQPGAALKIPLVWGGKGFEKGRKVMREFIALESTIPDGVPRVKILDKGANGEFVVVTKVDVKTDGKEFLEQFKGAADQKDQEKELRRVVHLSAGRDPTTNPLSQYSYENLARQFGWDGKRWTLLDWE